ncbi:leader peptidase (prepilin peptidase) / N-methyltransferase [Streptomyces sp. KS_5]|nr:leader peptidase (prepilin peptidase) / N-methyltransferase [Streptomyces sp. PAN_FS17]SEE06284.1 leader peptidase (prepilin peptidase) / N-methyltransferase [Streptomyces sp. KS_5]
MELFLIITAAVLWGCGTGVLIPRPAYRFSVPAEEPWRTECPAGHPLAGACARWLGTARSSAGDTYARARSRSPPSRLWSVSCWWAPRGPAPELVVWLLLALAGVLLPVVDAAAHRLCPTRSPTLPAAEAALILLGVVALLPGAGGSWTSALLSSLILAACYLTLFLISRGFGFGDVKLALALGAVVG